MVIKKTAANQTNSATSSSAASSQSAPLENAAKKARTTAVAAQSLTALPQSRLGIRDRIGKRSRHAEPAINASSCESEAASASKRQRLHSNYAPDNARPKKRSRPDPESSSDGSGSSLPGAAKKQRISMTVIEEIDQMLRAIEPIEEVFAYIGTLKATDQIAASVHAALKAKEIAANTPYACRALRTALLTIGLGATSEEEVTSLIHLYEHCYDEACRKVNADAELSEKDKRSFFSMNSEIVDKFPFVGTNEIVDINNFAIAFDLHLQIAKRNGRHIALAPLLATMEVAHRKAVLDSLEGCGNRMPYVRILNLLQKAIKAVSWDKRKELEHKIVLFRQQLEQAGIFAITLESDDFKHLRKKPQERALPAWLRYINDLIDTELPAAIDIIKGADIPEQYREKMLIKCQQIFGKSRSL